MPLTKSKKEEIVKKLAEKIGRAKALVFVRFHGLSVAKASEVRRLFAANDADYTVAKKTLIGIALEESGKGAPAAFEGEIGLVAGYGDPLALFKTALGFAKKEKDAFQIAGGFFDGKFIDGATAKALGAIPAREVLLAQIIGVIQDNTRKLVYLVDQLSKKGQS